MKVLPHKTVERLSQYRRILLSALRSGKNHIFSHEIAGILHITPVQVRRDIMLIGYSGTLKKGYDIKGLIDQIAEIIDSDEGLKIAIIGIGNLGRAIVNYLSGKRTKLSIVAAFDVNIDKVDKRYAGVQCFHIDKLEEVITKEKITLAVLTVPPEKAVEITEILIKTGVKGILNYTSVALNVPKGVYLEEYSIITSLEKVAFFAKH